MGRERVYVGNERRSAERGRRWWCLGLVLALATVLGVGLLLWAGGAAATDRSPLPGALPVHLDRAAPAAPSAPQPAAADPSAGRPHWHRVAATIPLTPGIGLEPVAIAADPHSPLTYVVNRGSRDLTVLSGTQVLGMVPLISDWENSQYPLHAAVDPSSGLLYLLQPVLDRCNPLHMNVWLQTIRVTETVGTELLYHCDLWEGSHYVGCGAHGLAFQPRNGYLYALLWHGDSAAVSPRGEVVVLQAGQVITRIATPGISPRAVAADPTEGSVYVTFRFTDAVSILSGTAIVGTVPVSDPLQVEVDPERGLAYVESGEEGLVVLSGTGRLGQIPLEEVAEMEVDRRTGRLLVSHPDTFWVTVLSATEVLTRVNLSAAGQALAVDPARGLVYVGHPAAPWVTVLSGTTVVTEVAVAGGNSVIEANPEGGLAYVVDGDRSLSVIEGTERRATLLPAFPRPQAMVVHPDDGMVYLLGDPPLLAAISGTSIVASLPLTAAPGEMEIEPQSGLIYLTLPQENAVLVFEGTSLRARVALPGSTESPVGLAVQPRTGLVYVLDLSGTVSVLQGTHLLSTIAVGSNRHLRRIAASPANGLVYVTDFGRSTVTVISRTEVVDILHLDGHPLRIALSARDGVGYAGGYERTAGWPNREGRLWVLSHTAVLTSVHSSWQPQAMAVSSATGCAYLALEPLPYADRCAVVQVWQGSNRLTTWEGEMLPGGRARFSAIVADPERGHVYLGQAGQGGWLSIGWREVVVQHLSIGDGSGIRAIAVDGPARQAYVASDHAIAILEQGAWPYNFHLPLVPLGRPSVR